MNCARFGKCSYDVNKMIVAVAMDFCYTDYVEEEPAIAVETDIDSYTPDDTKDTMVLFMKVVLGGATAVGAICCICAIARKASRGLLESPDGGMAESCTVSPVEW